MIKSNQITIQIKSQSKSNHNPNQIKSNHNPNQITIQITIIIQLSPHELEPKPYQVN